MVSEDRYSLLILFLSCLVVKSTSSIYYIEDVDSLRFALSVYDKFDLLKLQPHFPGYSVFCFFANCIYVLTGSLAYSFSIIGGVSTFLIIYFSLITFNLKINSKEGLFAILLIMFNPMIWLLGNRYMPDLMGLSIFVASFYLIAHQDSKYRFWGFFLSGLMLGVRLSYFPLIIVPLLLGLKNTFSYQKMISSLYFFAGVFIWLAPTILMTGLDDFLYVALNQSVGHFTDYGGTILTESNILERFLFFSHTIWSDGLGGYWSGRSIISLFLSVFIILFAFYAMRHLRFELKNNRNLKILFISIVLYFIWIILFQNVIYKSRHVLPIVFFALVIIVVMYHKYLFQKRQVLSNAVAILFIVLSGLTSIFLSVQHSQGTAVSNLSSYIETVDSNSQISFVSTPLINFHLKSTGVNGEFYSIDNKEDIQYLKENLSDKKIMLIGDFNQSFSNELVLDTTFYHNPYMNRMWSSINIYSNINK